MVGPTIVLAPTGAAWNLLLGGGVVTQPDFLDEIACAGWRAARSADSQRVRPSHVGRVSLVAMAASEHGCKPAVIGREGPL